MNAKKNILAFLLFFTYSISLLHAMVPHSHDFEHKNSEEQIHFENLADDQNLENNILHQDHIDENIFDLIICIFSHTPHSDEIDHQIAQNNAPATTNIFQHVAPIVYFWLDNIIQSETIAEQAETTIYVNLYQFDYFTTIDLRGPPAFLV